MVVAGRANCLMGDLRSRHTPGMPYGRVTRWTACGRGFAAIAAPLLACAAVACGVAPRGNPHDDAAAAGTGGARADAAGADAAGMGGAFTGIAGASGGLGG